MTAKSFLRSVAIGAMVGVQSGASVLAIRPDLAFWPYLGWTALVSLIANIAISVLLNLIADYREMRANIKYSSDIYREIISERAKRERR